MLHYDIFCRWGLLERFEIITARTRWEIKRVELYSGNDGDFAESCYWDSEIMSGGTRNFHNIEFNTLDIYQTPNVPGIREVGNIAHDG